MSAESANIGIALKTPDHNPKREEPSWEKSDAFSIWRRSLLNLEMIVDQEGRGPTHRPEDAKS